MTDQWWRATRQRRRIKVEVMQRCTRLMRKGHIPKRGCTKQSVTKCRRSDTHHIQQWIYINIRWKCVFSQQSNGPWSGLRNAFGGFVTSGNHTVATTVGKAWTEDMKCRSVITWITKPPLPCAESPVGALDSWPDKMKQKQNIQLGF